MFIAKNKNLIVMAKDTLNELQEAIKYMVVDTIEETENTYILYNGSFLTQDEIIKERLDRFNTEFFNTSLGYIRRKVTMKDRNIKDFLSDLLPTITMAFNMGNEVKIIAYDMPDFDEEVTDWEQYQHNETVTAQFIQECFMQLSADFGVVNESVEA